MERSTISGCVGLCKASCALPLCTPVIHSPTFAAAASATFNATLPITSAHTIGLVQCSQHVSTGLAADGLMGRRLPPRANVLNLTLGVAVGLRPRMAYRMGGRIPASRQECSFVANPMIVHPELLVPQTCEAVSCWLRATKRRGRCLIPSFGDAVDLSLIGCVAR
jgi:hypothetical protein